MRMSCSLGFVVLGLFGVYSSAAGASLGLANALSNGESKISQHVYVGDTRAQMVFRFPIVAGVVAAMPDLTLRTALAPSGVAIGPRGRLYVAVPSGILVYARGARGNDKPIASISLPLAIRVVVVDANGYMFARTFTQSGYTIVYVVSPSGTIVNSFAPNSGTLALDAQGNLYVGYDERVDVYATPETIPTLIRSSCVRFKRLGLDGITVTAQGDLLLVHIGSLTRVRDTIDACPLPDGLFGIFVIDNPALFLPAAAATNESAFTVEYVNKRLLQLSLNKGHQVPTADVRYSGFSTPNAVAVGP